MLKLKKVLLAAVVALATTPVFAAPQSCTTGSMVLGLQKAASSDVTKAAYSNDVIINDIWHGPKATFGLASVAGNPPELVVLVSSKETGDIWQVAACPN